MGKRPDFSGMTVNERLFTSGLVEQFDAAIAAGDRHRAIELLQQHVAESIDRFRCGELDAFDVDEVVFQYSRAAKELWKFCNIGDVELTAGQLREGPPIDWWERGTPRRARPRVCQAPTNEPR